MLDVKRWATATSMKNETKYSGIWKLVRPYQKQRNIFFRRTRNSLQDLLLRIERLATCTVAIQHPRMCSSYDASVVVCFYLCHQNPIPLASLNWWMMITAKRYSSILQFLLSLFSFVCDGLHIVVCLSRCPALSRNRTYRLPSNAAAVTTSYTSILYIYVFVDYEKQARARLHTNK